MTKTEQLEEMLAVCRDLGAEVEYHPEYGHFTAMVWETAWIGADTSLSLRKGLSEPNCISRSISE